MSKKADFVADNLTIVNPKLASEVSPNSPFKAEELTKGSNKKALWLCKNGHEWTAAVKWRTRGDNCPYCSGRKIAVGDNDLATVNPKLASEVSPKSKIKATEVTAGSRKKLLWRCTRNHEWTATVANRSNGNNCPYCTNRKVLPGFNDLATVNPKLASEVSSNSKVSAKEVTQCSRKKLLWRCEMGHEWEGLVSDRSKGGNCPYCSHRKVLPGFNDLATVNPKLASEVSPNSPLKAEEIARRSNKKILWLCKNEHEWAATVTNRTRGDNCPYCTNKKVLPGFNDLATVNPKLASEVSPNSKISAKEATGCSGKKLLWRCKMGHEWLAKVASRLNGENCPYCANAKVLPGFNDLATTNPKLASEVSPNSKISAKEVTQCSGKKLLWRCKMGHEWRSRPFTRERGTGCPYCTGRKVLPGFNDLATISPELEKQVSPKSKIKATEVTKASMKKLLWVCQENHEWLSTAMNRLRGCGCPQCAGSQAERDLAELVKSLLPKNIKILRNDRKVIKPYELDILVPELNLAFEFNGIYWHSDKMIRARKSSFPSSRAFDNFKKNECAKQGIKLFFVREKQWIENHEGEVKRVSEIVNQANGS